MSKETLFKKCSQKFSSSECDLLSEAVSFAETVHIDQKRESGEPYIIHPVAVAETLLDMGMDSASVIAGILHDTVEDGKDIDLAILERKFGKDIARLVDGVTKLTKSGRQEYITKKQEQSENLRKLFLAIADDVRVVIIKLADRLHNMRTLEYCTRAKQIRKAKETLEVYTPLAHRFGMGAIRSELEDLSFKYLMPDEYVQVKNFVSSQQNERLSALTSAMERMRDLLHDANIEADISGRPKHLYSTYKKMQRLGVPISEIYDLIAIRVIVKTVNDCYAALGVVHAEWKPLPGRFKDYIAMPKPNMYRSLHTTVMNRNSIPFEVQIRTEEMHRTAEYGVAAHWMYKEGRTVQTELDKKTSWLREVVEAKDTTEDSSEFVENIVHDFLGEFVYVLTPKGEIIDLPIGSTPLDFAYRIHTNVGNHTQHAKVNGSVVKLDYKLRTNDVVEIITSNSQSGPSRDWLSIVKTQSAKNKIRQWFKKTNREENIQKGREMLEESARRQALDLAKLMRPEFLKEIFEKLNFSCVEDLYSAIGYGGITSGQVLHKLGELYSKNAKVEDIHKQLLSGMEEKKTAPALKRTGITSNILVNGDSGMAVHFASCCNPLPGDEIQGYITRGRGVSVHRADCKNINGMRYDKERFIPVSWNLAAAGSFTATVCIELMDKTGSLLEVSRVLSNMNVYVANMDAQNSVDGVGLMHLTFTVSSKDQLTVVMNNLKKIKSVLNVTRSD